MKDAHYVSLNSAQTTKTHFHFFINSTYSWEQLRGRLPKTELMQYAMTCQEEFVLTFQCQPAPLRFTFWMWNWETPQERRPFWKAFESVPWPSYGLPITLSIISQLHQCSKPVQRGRSHTMTSTHQMNLTENTLTFSILHAGGRMMDAPEGHLCWDAHLSVHNKSLDGMKCVMAWD